MISKILGQAIQDSWAGTMKKIGVVFVHGFMGGEATWQNSKGEKLSKLLRSDGLDIDFEFHEFNYFTKLSDLFDSAFVKRVLSKIPGINRLKFTKGRINKTQPIENIARMLDAFVRLELHHLDEVIFIGHSMGGLVIKAYLLAGNTDVIKPVGFVSVAVPHKGSLNAVLLGKIISNVNASELAPLNAYTDAINNEWVELKNSMPPTIYIMAANDECVPLASATPCKIPQAEQFLVDHDHLSVCKPEDVTDITYKCIHKFLKSCASISKFKQELEASYPADASIYDKEIFVIKMILCDIGAKGIDNAKESFFYAEIIDKAVDKSQRGALKALQANVLSLYRTVYNKYNGKKTPNEVFADVHLEIIKQDAQVLNCGINAISFLHKQGMLHQYANELSDKVVWSDSTDMAVVEAQIK